MGSGTYGGDYASASWFKKFQTRHEEKVPTESPKWWNELFIRDRCRLAHENNEELPPDLENCDSCLHRFICWTERGASD
jgi:hypothetical protein